MPKKNNPGCKCCCKVGFDEGAWPIQSCLPNVEFVENIADDISKLNEVCLVFAGNVDACSNAVRFDAGDWETIRDWIERGGRLFLATEYQGCLQDPGATNNFLGTLGSSITWVGGIFDFFCRTGMIPGPAQIAQGLTDNGMAATAILSGGTTMFTSPNAGVVMMVVEQIGDGFLFVTGDSNHFQFCSFDNCELVRRLYRNGDNEII